MSRNANNHKILEQITTLTSSRVDSFNIMRPSQVPEVVYHYTNAAGLKGMLEKIGRAHV